MAEPRVVIVLSTFNGERYLAEQLDSIRRQTFPRWRLLLRDDASTDASRRIAEAAARRDPERIKIVNDDDGNLGVVAAYSRLVERAEADYILFADQDDLWLPDKIDRTLAAMRAAEQRHGVQTPLLVHTDLRVVDQSLRTLAPSFWRYRRLDPVAEPQLRLLLAHNGVTGCAMMINRSLASLAAPFPPAAAMHDWWLALVACLFGRVEAVNAATVLYRQHGDNSVGASRWGWRRALDQLGNPRAVRAGLLRGMRQARALLDRYHQGMPADHAALVAAYASLPFLPPGERLGILLTHRLRKHGFLRTVGFLVNVLALPREVAAAPVVHR